jgi:hypothetical protein
MDMSRNDEGGARMNRTHWILAICLGLLVLGGAALDVSAQQPTAPTAPSETAPPPSPAQPAPQPPPSAPKTEYGGQPQQAPPTGSQIETRPIPLDGGDRGSILGVDPTLAMVIGAVLVIVVVIALVAMGRRSTHVRHTHTPRHHV